MVNKDGFASLDGSLDESAQMASAFEAELEGLRQSMLYTTREVGTLSRGIEGGLRKAFDGLIFDGATLAESLRGVARSMSETAYSIAMRPIQQSLSLGLAHTVTGAVSAALPFAAGGAFSQGRVMPFAHGGVVSSPTTFPMRGGTGLMGEAGPEAIVPLTRGADGRLGVRSTGGGRGAAITINIQTPDVEGFRRSQSQIAAQLSRALAVGQRNA